MAITRTEKEQAVSQLTDQLDNLKLAVLTDYRGLTAAEVSELRDILRAENIDYHITKNTLLRLAASSSTKFKDLAPETFNGPLALAIGSMDEIAPARLVFQFTREHEALEIVGALTAEGTLLSGAEVKALATLPTKEQLHAQVVGTIAAPLTSFVGVLTANLRNLINVINALAAQ